MARRIAALAIAAAILLDLLAVNWHGIPVSTVLVCLAGGLILCGNPSQPPKPSWTWALFCAAVCLAAPPTGGAGFREAAQLLLVIGVGWIVCGALAPEDKRWLGFLLAALAPVAAGLGFANFASPARLGLVAAVGLVALAATAPRWALWGVVPVAAVCGTAIDNGPLILLGAAGAAAITRRRSRLPQACAIFAVALLAVLLNRAAVESLRLHHADAQPKRGLLEMQATPGAISARSLGFGLGSYKNTIGNYHRSFPAHYDNRVAPDTNSTYLVWAVEGGIPLALAWLLLVGGSILGKGKQDHERVFGVVILIAGLFTTVITSHTGLVVAAALGVWRGKWPQAGWRPLWGPAALILTGCVGGLLRNPEARGQPVKPRILQSAVEEIRCHVFEAEHPAEPPSEGMDVREANGASGNHVLAIPVDAGKGKGTARYSVQIPPGTYHLWLRVFWEDGCGNSVGVVVGESSMIVSDSRYGLWHWVRAPRMISVPVSSAELLIRNLEDGVMIDQFLWVGREDFVPAGVMKAR